MPGLAQSKGEPGARKVHLAASRPGPPANLKNDGITPQQYTWDAENRPHTLSVGTTVTVVYDALGRAVENQSGTNQEILYAPGIGKVALMNGAALVKAWVPLPGGGKAVYTSTGLTYYQHGDWLSSSRLTSKPNRTTYFEGAYAPFGEDYAENGTNDLSFTGQTQDTLPGKLYDFLYRRYHPVQGRWISPDPAGVQVVDPSNPQTWNRYAYVLNNPMSFNDPTGLDCNNHTASSPCVYTTVNVSADEYAPSWYTFVFLGGSFSSWSQMFCMMTGGCYSSQPTSTNTGGGGGGQKDALPPAAQTVAKGVVQFFQGNKEFQNCRSDFLNNNYPKFVAKSLVPNFSLVSFTGNPGPFLKTSGESLVVKGTAIGGGVLGGQLLSKSGQALVTSGTAASSVFPSYGGAMVSQGTSALAWGGKITALAGGTAEVIGGLATEATVFATAADINASYNCQQTLPQVP